jgi:16S rRNA (uracil1498-N3)-methyltransferase
MSQRFFSERPIHGGEVTIGGPEAHHLLHVLRASVGQPVTLLDGTGREFQARIVQCGRREVRLQVESTATVSREPSLAIHLAAALPKGERQRWLVEKAVELGVTVLTPLGTERGVAQPNSAALERLRRTVVEATKQCGRTRLMQVAEPVDVLDHLAAPSSAQSDETLAICAHPGGQNELPPAGPSVRTVQLVVGPEGGFTDAEVAAARRHGWRVVQLGPRILRVETAAIALAALYSLGDLG